MSGGKKILDGLKDAVDGNFARVTIEGQTWVKVDKNRDKSKPCPVCGFHLRSVERQPFVIEE